MQSASAQASARSCALLSSSRAPEQLPVHACCNISCTYPRQLHMSSAAVRTPVKLRIQRDFCARKLSKNTWTSGSARA
eukprot:5333845-Alexandrium_andersonii.AAC.1